MKEILEKLYKYFPNSPKSILKTNELYNSGSSKGIFLSTEKIKKDLNWDCKVNLENGIKELLSIKLEI
jgi:nucleoside-diphosphate-sugar epimerase